MPQYLTHHNGGRPFKVHIEGEHVRVFRTPRYRDDDMPDLLVAEYIAPEIMIGRHADDEPWADGNSILLRIAELEYVFIGHTIFSFHALARITKYSSPVGNSDVPYPWAEDRDGHVYLMMGGIIMLNHVWDRPNWVASTDPYAYYFRHEMQVPADWGLFFVLRPNGEEVPHVPTFEADPGSAYAWFAHSAHWSGICTGTLDEKEKRFLSETDYRDLIRRLGELKGFRSMQTRMEHEMGI